MPGRRAIQILQKPNPWLQQQTMAHCLSIDRFALEVGIMAEKEGRFHRVDGKQWKDSPAKAMLILDIKSGKVKPGDSAAEVQEMREEYMKWPAQCFRNNMNNLLKNFVNGKKPFDVKGQVPVPPATPGSVPGAAAAPAPAPTPSPAPPAGTPARSTGQKADVDSVTAGIASLGFLSAKEDEDDFHTGVEDDAFSMIPDEIKIGSTTMHRVVFPMLQIGWEDKYGRRRLTLIIHLPSGAYRRDFIKYKVMGHDQKVYLFFDWSKFRVLDPEKYGKAFRDSSGLPLYAEGDTKVVAFKRKIRKLKGKTTFDPVKSVFEIDLDIKCINKVTDAEGYKGFQILKMNDEGGKAPQIFCHMELMGTAHGHYVPAVDNVQDYLSDDSAESDDEFKEADGVEGATPQEKDSSCNMM